MWFIKDKISDEFIIESGVPSKEKIVTLLENLPISIQKRSKLVHISDNNWLDSILTEGLLKNDLQGILLPKISFDEYLPKEEDEKNIVLAFFIKNVPEAVIPLKNFFKNCEGVISTDHGDSDTISNTSIVYVEMSDVSFNFRDFDNMIEELGMVSGFNKQDFTMSFPNSNKRFPYDLKIVQQYIDIRQNLFDNKSMEEENPNE